MYYGNLLIVSAAAIFGCLAGQGSAAEPEESCAEVFQAQLKELLATRESCRSAAFRNCCQIKQLLPNATSGVYRIMDLPAFQSPFRPPTTLEARCDMDTENGGWTVIQRRVPNGTVNFTRGWCDYENGFGDLEGEFWYGLTNIHYLTSREDVELRIDMIMEDDGSQLSWTYQTFTVAAASDKYRLTIGGGQGPGRDAMAIQNGQQFSTYDNDNDQLGSTNCGFTHQGGWWYNRCYLANLNGPHETPTTPGVEQRFARLIWNDETYRDVAGVEMKIRAKGCILDTDSDAC